MKTKSTLFALVAGLAIATSANGMVIVAGWYQFDPGTGLQTADQTALGVTGGLTMPIASPGNPPNNNIAVGSGGSDSGLYGLSTYTIGAAPNTLGSAGFVQVGPASQVPLQAAGELIFNLTNGPTTLFLTNLYFDALTGGEVPKTLTIFDGTSAIVQVNTATTNPAGSPPTEAYEKFAVSLGGSNGITLNPGQNITFRFTSPNGSLQLDNIGFEGTVIPEPTNVMALALLLTSGVMFRNRRRKA